MKVKLENPVVLSKLIEIISELVTEVRLKVNEFGMSVVAIDPANVAMVGFRLPKSFFSIFETENEILGINLDDFKRILKRCGTKSSLILEREESILNIKIEDKILRKFSLRLINVESEDKEMPSLEFSSRVEINSTDFVDSIEDCSVVAEACSFIVDNGKFIIESRGMNSARAEFSGDESEIKAEDCKARYSLEYLSKFIKGCKLSEKTILNFATNHPLKMDLRDNGMELNFILAPRVETED
jgi:proliferating cell nuclear antigen